MFVTIVVFLLILSILVLVHELGHFLVAKKLGIKVEEFGFGLPPKAFGIKKGETIYSINWLPIGGFVKLYGEDEAGGGSIKVKGQKSKVKSQIHRAFFARPAWQRALVVTAGVIMNFLLAVVIISFLFSAVGVSVPGNKVVIAEVIARSPASVAGLKTGDVVFSINGIKITNATQLVSITKQNLGKKITLEVKSQKSKVKNIEVTPRLKYPVDEGPMGVAVSPNIEVKKYPWYLAPFLGTKEALSMSWLIASGLFHMFYQLIFTGVMPKGVAGPVGIAQLTGQFVAVGPIAVMSFISLLSLNLAILNILPFPALDGGRLFFIIIELISGKKVNVKYEGYAHAVGMAILIGLILLITINDLIRVFTGQPVIPSQ
jgi:regulator of sigma E protease